MRARLQCHYRKHFAADLEAQVRAPLDVFRRVGQGHAMFSCQFCIHVVSLAAALSHSFTITNFVYATRKPCRSMFRCDPLPGCVITTAVLHPAFAALLNRSFVIAAWTPLFRNSGIV